MHAFLKMICSSISRRDDLPAKPYNAGLGGQQAKIWQENCFRRLLFDQRPRHFVDRVSKKMLGKRPKNICQISIFSIIPVIIF